MLKLVMLLSVAAMVAAKPSLLAPVAYNAVVPGVSSVSQYSSSVIHGSPVVYGASVYSTPAIVPAYTTLSQAPQQPAVVLDAVNGVPLDTPEVVAARAAHYTAKALAPYHHLRKRSVGIAPLTYSSVVSPVSYSTPLVSTYNTPLVSTYSAPVVTSYAGLYPRALSIHPY